MYYRTLVDEELLRMAEPVTELEKDLVRRFQCQQWRLKEDLEEAYEELRKENNYLQNRVDELEEKLDVFIPQ